MTSTAKNILGVVPGLMATNLVIKTIPDMNNFGKTTKKGKGKSSKRILYKGYLNSYGQVLVGIPLIGATATEINKLS